MKKQEITIPDGVTPSLIASNDRTRLILNGAQIKNNKLTVCDGRMVLEINVEGDAVEDGAIIPKAILKRVEKCKSIRHVEIEGDSVAVINVDDETKTVGALIVGKFPDTEQLFSEVHKKPVIFTARLDAAKLMKLAKSINNKSQAVQLDFTGDGEAIQVKSIDAKAGHRAILMPVIT